MMETIKRGRGRPKGSKDKKPRSPRRLYVPIKQILDQPLTVVQKLRMLKYPQRLKIYAQITGLSVALLRKKVEVRSRRFIAAEIYWSSLSIWKRTGTVEDCNVIAGLTSR